MYQYILSFKPITKENLTSTIIKLIPTGLASTSYMVNVHLNKTGFEFSSSVHHPNKYNLGGNESFISKPGRSASPIAFLVPPVGPPACSHRIGL